MADSMDRIKALDAKLSDLDREDRRDMVWLRVVAGIVLVVYSVAIWCIAIWV